MKELLSTLVKSKAVWSVVAVIGTLALVIPFALHTPGAAVPTAQTQPTSQAPKPTVTPKAPTPKPTTPPKPTPKPTPTPTPTPKPSVPPVKPPVVTPPVTPPVVTPPVVTPPVTPPVTTPPVVTPPVVTPPVVTPPVVTPPVVTPPVVTPPVVTPPTPTRPQTVVSLTFDDGNADQLGAAATMRTYNVKGTFYVVSGYVGASGYFTRADLSALAASGNEIGGHTVTHPDLAVLPNDEVQRQVCTDRANLSSWGFAVRSFAYPFASSTPANEAAVSYCGYNSARMLGDIKSRFGCADCDYAETIPPSDPFYTKALDQVDSTWTLADLQNGVLNAERTGGWVQYTFHNVCTTSCSELAVKQSVFDAFVAWLAPRSASMNTVTKTVGDVIGGAVKPVVTAPAGSTAVVVNPGLENVGSTGVPTCWFQAPYGDNVAAFSLAPGRNGSSVANRITMSSYVSGDAKLLPTFDLGSCAPSVVTGHNYSLRSWYNSTVPTQFAVYLRTTSGAWQYWTSSPWFSASSTWTEAAWTTPTIPEGFNGISFGLNIFSNGVLTTDDHSIYDAVGAPAPDSTPPTPPAAPAAPSPTPSAAAPLVAPAPEEQATIQQAPAEPTPTEPVVPTPEVTAPTPPPAPEVTPPAPDPVPAEPTPAPAAPAEGTTPQP